MAPKLLLAASMDWPFPARLAQAFAALGARVEAVCPKTSPLRRSAAPARLHSFSVLRPLATLANAIQRTNPDLIIPCDDLIAELLWRLGRTHGEFTFLLERSFGRRDAYPMLVGRNAFLHAAEEAGAPIAENVPVETEADLNRAAARLGLPVVVKADGSWGGDGVAVARELDAAKVAFADFSQMSRLKAVALAFKRREPYLLLRARFAVMRGLSAQRYIVGHPTTSAIACWRGRLLAANHFDVTMSNGNGPATVIARADCRRMQNAASRIAQRFGLSGLYGLDYMRDAEGQIFLLEINPRATPTTHLALGPNHDLAAALLSAAGFAVPDRPAITQQDRIALFPQELRRDPKSSHLAGAYHDLPLDDPGLTAALIPRGVTLTSFSQAFSGLSGQAAAAGPPIC